MQEERVMLVTKSYDRVRVTSILLSVSLSLLSPSLSLYLRWKHQQESDTTLLSPGHRSTGETRQTIITSGGKQRCISPPSCTAHVVAKRHIYGPVGVIELWISGFGISSFTAPGCGRLPPSATITFLSVARDSIHPSRHVHSDADSSTSGSPVDERWLRISTDAHGNIVSVNLS